MLESSKPLTQEQQQDLLDFESLLGVQSIEMEDTWHDDENQKKASIIRYFTKHITSRLKPIKVIPDPKWKQFLAKELFDWNGVLLVFVPGMPDSLVYRKCDESKLLEFVEHNN